MKADCKDTQRLIERLRNPGDCTSRQQCYEADAMAEAADALEAKDRRIEELVEQYGELAAIGIEQAKRTERLEAALRKIKEALGEDFIVHELRCALDNSDPGRYPHPEDKRYYEEMRPHLEAVLKHFGGNE